MMIYSKSGAGISLAAAFVAALVASPAAAQAPCATCPQPTVAYSPVVAAPPTVALQPVQPVVYQQPAPAYRGWYPGKYLSRLFSRPTAPAPAYAPPSYAAQAYAQPVVAQPTFVTSAYRPTYPPSYTTYSATYAPTVQTVARPVTLAPVYSSYPSTTAYANPCNTCGSPCDSYGCSSCSSGVVAAGYETPANPGCSSCAAGGSTYAAPSGPPASSTYGAQQSLQPTPAPALPRGSNVPENRALRVPVEDPAGVPAPAGGEASPNDLDASGTTWFEAPQLYDNRDRSAARSMPSQHGPTTGVWNAVYQQPAGSRTYNVQRTSFGSKTQPETRRHKVIDMSGWESVD